MTDLFGYPGGRNAAWYDNPKNFEDLPAYVAKPKCYTKHSELSFGDGVLVGASCGSPREGFDVYIGLDWGMSFNHQRYPWNSNGADEVIEVQFRITDGCAPKAPAQFKKMITWICTQLKNGKRVHVGCIGGHGRKGLVIAAVRNVMDGDTNATAWTRKHHCKKAVETKSQVNFLHKHFGIKKVKGSKHGLFDNKSGTVTGRMSGKRTSKANKPKTNKVIPLHEIDCVHGKGSIWG